MIRDKIKDLLADYPDSLVDAIIGALGLESEWAIAEYDAQGNLIHVSGHDYDPAPVLASLKRQEDSLRDNNIQIEGSIRMVSRTFTEWSGDG